MGWNLVVLPALSAWIGVVELDVALVGQWMLGRPIIVGPLMGLACGQLGIGLAMGALTELFSLENSPVGSVVPINGVVAAGCSVLLAAGPMPVAVAAAFPAGLACGTVHAKLETWIRNRRSKLTVEAARGLSREWEVDWVRLLFKSLAIQFATTALFVYIAVLGLAPALSLFWEFAPQFAIKGFNTAFGMAPWFGLAAIIHMLFRKI